MGIEKNIGIDKFPQQRDIGREVDVMFHYDPSKTLIGKIVRDDAEKPYITIIELEDGRYVLAKECTYGPRT